MKITTCLCLAAVAAVLFASCSPIVTPIDTSKIYYRAENLNYEEFRKSKVALLPIVTEQGPDAVTLKQQAGKALYKSMKKQFPDMQIVSSDTSATLINNADLSGDYAHLIDDYKISGILRKSTLAKLQAATGCRYLLYTELQKYGYPTSVTTKSGAIYNVKATVTEFAYNSELWDTEKALLAWKGVGSEARSVTDTIFTNDNMLLPNAADNLAKRVMQNAINIKDGDNATKIIEEVNNNQAVTGSVVLTILLGALVLAPIIAISQLHH